MAAAIGVLALLLYVPRAFRTLSLMGDSAELLTAAVAWGVPHAPGYPLYTAVEHAVTRIPFGDLPLRVHLTSALFHAGTVACVVGIVAEITSSVAFGTFAGLVLALSRAFFVGSLYAEVFPLNDLLFAICVLLAVRIARQHRRFSQESTASPPSDGGTASLLADGSTASPPSDGMVAAFMTCCGLACAHHFMMALAIPTLALLVGPALWARLRRAPRQAVRPAAGWALALFGPLALSYPLLFLAARHNQEVSWGDIHDWRSFVYVVTRQDYGGLFSASAHAAPNQLLERLDLYFETLGRSFGLTAALGLLGLVAAFRLERSLGVPIVVGFLLSGPGFAALNAFEIHSEHRAAYFERFVTMSHVAVAVLIGMGIAVLEGVITTGAPRRCAARRWIARSAALLSVLRLVPPARRIDFHGDRLAIRYAHDLIEATPDHSLVLLAGDMSAHAAQYICVVERACGARIVLSPGQLHLRWRADQVARGHPNLPIRPLMAGGSTLEDQVGEALRAMPVYLHPEVVRKHPALQERFVLIPELLLLRVYATDAAVEDDRELKVRYDEVTHGVHCSGCDEAIPPGLRPSMQTQLLSAYAVGLGLQAESANTLGWSEEAGWFAERAEAFRKAAR